MSVAQPEIGPSDRFSTVTLPDNIPEGTEAQFCDL